MIRLNVQHLPFSIFSHLLSLEQVFKGAMHWTCNKRGANCFRVLYRFKKKMLNWFLRWSSSWAAAASSKWEERLFIALWLQLGSCCCCCVNGLSGNKLAVGEVRGSFGCRLWFFGWSSWFLKEFWSLLGVNIEIWQNIHKKSWFRF